MWIFIEEIKSFPWLRINATNKASPTLASQAPNVKIMKVKKRFLTSPTKEEIIKQYKPKTIISSLNSAFNKCFRCRVKETIAVKIIIILIKVNERSVVIVDVLEAYVKRRPCKPKIEVNIPRTNKLLGESNALYLLSKQITSQETTINRF